MEDASKIRLTSTEIAALWSGYSLESLVHYVFQYFVTHIEDQEIRTYIQRCWEISKNHMDGIEGVMKQENFPIPRGITSEDIIPNASRLFSDVFVLHYTKNMAKFALTVNALSYTE